MASSMRNDLHPQLAPEDGITAPKEDTTLNLGHAGLACECWSGGRQARSATRGNGMAATGRPAPRHRCATRSGVRHLLRPSQPAEPRFAAANSAFLTK